MLAILVSLTDLALAIDSRSLDSETLLRPTRPADHSHI